MSLNIFFNRVAENRTRVIRYSNNMNMVVPNVRSSKGRMSIRYRGFSPTWLSHMPCWCLNNTLTAPVAHLVPHEFWSSALMSAVPLTLSERYSANIQHFPMKFLELLVKVLKMTGIYFNWNRTILSGWNGHLAKSSYTVLMSVQGCQYCSMSSWGMGVVWVIG